MIDCSNTEGYFAEKLRMTKKHKLNGGAYICELNCIYCPLSSPNNGSSDMMSCSDFETIFPQKAIEIVQRWSNEHPPKTLLTEFLERYPNAKMNGDGFPSNIVPCSLGLIERKDICKNRCLYFYDKGHPCYDCWNTPIEESEE